MDFNKFQQHFMVNQEIIARIIELAELKKDDLVLEIGAGTGNLTKELAKHSKVITFEIDIKFKKELEAIQNVKVYIGNFLNFEIEEKFTKIVSNIPYNLCEPLLWKFLRLDFGFAILTVPEKFYKTLNDESSKLIYFNEIFDIKNLLDVPKESFKPKPRTNSVVIKITKKPRMNSLIQELIYQYDKLLKNALIEYFSKSSTKKQAKEKIKDLDIKIKEKNITELSKKEIDKVISYYQNKPN